jgi:hypothetical protein|tara:strand:+ start:3006 stop:3425 length:420 start_codon:yes stop_codon:yes gene_type:complete
MGRYVKNPQLVQGGSTGVGNVLPVGTTSQRPATSSAGSMRYNSTLNMLEFHNGTEYVQVRGAVNGQHPVTVDNFTLDGSTTAYTMSLTPKHERNILVFMEGVFQKHSTYSVSSNTLTLTPSYPADATKVVTVIHGLDYV